MQTGYGKAVGCSQRVVPLPDQYFRFLTFTRYLYSVNSVNHAPEQSGASRSMQPRYGDSHTLHIPRREMSTLVEHAMEWGCVREPTEGVFVKQRRYSWPVNVCMTSAEPPSFEKIVTRSPACIVVSPRGVRTSSPLSIATTRISLPR